MSLFTFIARMRVQWQRTAWTSNRKYIELGVKRLFSVRHKAGAVDTAGPKTNPAIGFRLAPDFVTGTKLSRGNKGGAAIALTPYHTIPTEILKTEDGPHQGMLK